MLSSSSVKEWPPPKTDQHLNIVLHRCQNCGTLVTSESSLRRNCPRGPARTRALTVGRQSWCEVQRGFLLVHSVPDHSDHDHRSAVAVLITSAQDVSEAGAKLPHFYSPVSHMWADTAPAAGWGRE